MHRLKLYIIALSALVTAPSFGAITYIDALAGSSGNTYATGGSLTNTSWVGTASGQWRMRTDVEGNEDTLFQGNASPAELTTELTGLSNGTYTIWAFYWDQTESAGNNWVLSAGLTSRALASYSSPGEPAVTNCTTSGVVDAETLNFTTTVKTTGTDNSARNLFGVNLGQAIVSDGSVVKIYIDNEINALSGSDNRTWYDGVGYETAPELDTSKKPNVLLICVDDLRPETGAYGSTYMHTPNMDRLASEGRLFMNHFCQSATCGSSRYSMLTGMRYNILDSQSTDNEVMVKNRPSTEPQQPWNVADLFQRNGYRTVMTGKISHHPDGYIHSPSSTTLLDPADEEMPFSWDEIFIPPAFFSKWGSGYKAFFGYADGSTRTPGVSPPMEHGDAGTSPAPIYPDIAIADGAIQKLGELATNRFFLAVGFNKPHLPFNAPQEYFDLYTNSLPSPPNPYPSTGVSSSTQSQSGEILNNYGHGPQPSDWNTQTNSPYETELRRSYFACVSFVDAQIGRVLDEVDRLGLATNTIVVLWGDHGWHLGDNGLWGKHTRYERSARSALIIRTPQQRFRGYSTDALVESVDIYPTLADLCNLNNPPPPTNLSGESLSPVLKDPNHPGKNEAITYWNPATSLRTDRYRMIYYHNNGVVDLFDHESDPWETTNVAQSHPTVVSNLTIASINNWPVMQPVPDHYQEWIAQQFSAAQQTDTNIAGRLQNPDGDDFLNVQEYHQGSSPTSFTASAVLEPIFVNQGGTNYFGVQFNRNMGATDLTTQINTSSSLANPLWDRVDPDDLRYRISSTVTGSLEILTIRDTRPLSGETNRFTQLELNWEE